MRDASGISDLAPGAPGAPAVSVIVPARDAAPTLERSLRALAAQELDEPFEVLIVDDGSTDETAAIASRWAPGVRLVGAENDPGAARGPGAARNRGAAEARAPVLAFTDADCFPAPGWLASGLRAIREGADLVQGAVAPEPGATRTPFDRTVIVSGENGLYPTANVLVRRELFAAVGGFRDWLADHERAHGRRRFAPRDRRRSRAARTPIGEDTLFAWQARRRGARTVFAPGALVHHAVVPGRLWDEILDRWHWASDMPAVAGLVPELRTTCFHRRWFFSRKTARFDVALAAVTLAALTHRRVALAAAWPYAAWILTEARRLGGADGLRHGLGSPVSDAATLAALVCGSVAWRTVLL
jgi:glycosyltransferase involved in cell wall biosynthesis